MMENAIVEVIAISCMLSIFHARLKKNFTVKCTKNIRILGKKNGSTPPPPPPFFLYQYNRIINNKCSKSRSQERHSRRHRKSRSPRGRDKNDDYRRKRS